MVLRQRKGDEVAFSQHLIAEALSMERLFYLHFQGHVDLVDLVQL